MPTLEAVVESPNPRIETWVPLPEPSPFYKMIRLSASASPEEVAMIVAQLTYYKRGAPALTMEQVVRESFHILPGGLQAVDGDVVIEPSCCCGLEEWRDWLDLLEGGPSPGWATIRHPGSKRKMIASLFTLTGVSGRTIVLQLLLKAASSSPGRSFGWPWSRSKKT